MCETSVMPSPPRGKRRPYMAPRTPDTQSISVSGSLEDDGPVVLRLNPPSSLTECISTNFTWTGGVAPYSLLVQFRYSSETLRQFDSIDTTHFVWAPDLPAGTLVSFEIHDEQNVLVATEDPILVGAGAPGVGCNSTFEPEPPVSIAPARSVSTSTSASSAPSSTLSQSPSSRPSASRKNPVSRGTIALTVVGVVILLVLGTFAWWWTRATARKREQRNGVYLSSFYDYPRRIDYTLVATERQECIGDGRNNGRVRCNPGPLGLRDHEH